MITRLRHLLLPGVLLAAGCAGDLGEPLALEGMGTLASTVFLDLNGNGQLDGSDAPAPGLELVLLRATGDTASSARSDASGRALFTGLPIGSYRIDVPAHALGDSISVMPSEAGLIRVAPRDTARVQVGVGYPRVTLRGARSAPLGKVVSVEGVAQYAANLFGDSTLVIADSSGTLRISGITSSAVQLGDSVKAIGRVGSYQGQPALTQGSLFRLGVGTLRPPLLLGSAAAAKAASGALDGVIVRVAGARVLEAAQLPGGDVRLKVDDGSGILEVLLDRDVQIVPEEPLLPGVQLDVTGVLAPRPGSNEWRLLPRGSNDLKIAIPQVTIAGARSLPIGQFVAIEAIAQNNYSTYANGDLYLSDTTGSIRAALGRSSFVFIGDRVRVLGFLGARNGQPVLLSASATVIGKADALPPQLLRSGAAASANLGTIDAALVRIDRAQIQEVQHGPSSTLLRVDDGSGPLIVTIEAGVGIGTGMLKQGMTLDLIGVLEPTPGGGSWELKPRFPTDLILHP